MEENLEIKKLYSPVNLPKEKYFLGIEGIRKQEILYIVSIVIFVFIFTLMKYGTDQVLFIVMPTFLSGGFSYAFLVINPVTNRSFLQILKGNIKFLLGTKTYEYEHLNKFKRRDHDKK